MARSVAPAEPGKIADNGGDRALRQRQRLPILSEQLLNRHREDPGCSNGLRHGPRCPRLRRAQSSAASWHAGILQAWPGRIDDLPTPAGLKCWCPITDTSGWPKYERCPGGGLGYLPWMISVRTSASLDHE